MVWIIKKAELEEFSESCFEHPISKNQLATYLKESKGKAYNVVFDSTKEIIGHCEIDYENNFPVIKHVLIGDTSFEGMGLEKKVLDTLLEKGFSQSPKNLIELKMSKSSVDVIRASKEMGFIEDDSFKCLNEVCFCISKIQWKANSAVSSKTN